MLLEQDLLAYAIQRSAMRRQAWVLLVAIVFGGCSSSYTLLPDGKVGNRKSISYEEMNRKLQEGNVTVFLVDGRELSVGAIRVDKDSATFTDSATDSLYHLATRHIVQIQRTDKVRGVIEGAIFGGLMGGTVGAGLIALDRGSDGGPGLLWVLIGGACAGTTVGVIAGVIKGHTYTYRTYPAIRPSPDRP
jgi:hypothetical protein